MHYVSTGLCSCRLTIVFMVVIGLNIFFQQSDLLDRLSGSHNWYSSSNTRPTFCNVCRDILPGVTAKGLSCEGVHFNRYNK